MQILFRLLSYLPLRCLQALGAAMGWLMWGLSPRLRQRFASHVAQAGVPMPQARAAIAASGRMLAELPWLWLRARSVGVLGRVQWRGQDLFDAALAAQKGVILALPHLGCWEMIGQCLAEQYGTPAAGQARSLHGPLLALYRPPRKPWLQPLVERSRQRPGMQTVPTNVMGVRSLLKALRAGGYTAILPDQVPPQGQGVWAPFFGQPAYTMTLLPRLAQQTGAAVLLCWCERLPAGRFAMHFEALGAAEQQLLCSPSSPPEDSARAMNAALERTILRCPGQYLWTYNRYKPPRQEP